MSFSNRLSLVVLPLSLCHCAGTSPLPTPRQTTLSAREFAPLAQIQADQSGLERFWKREGVVVGIVKWDSARSRAATEVPPQVMQEIRDEVGRLNQVERPGEDVWLTVNVYRWRKGFFSSTPVACVEIVGRDQLGQVVWMGEGQVEAKAALADSLADTPGIIVAKELLRRLRAELAL